MLSLPMAFAKMTLTMNNAIMTALIAALHPVIRTIALNVIAKVFLIISSNYRCPDYILNFQPFKKKHLIIIYNTGILRLIHFFPGKPH